MVRRVVMAGRVRGILQAAIVAPAPHHPETLLEKPVQQARAGRDLQRRETIKQAIRCLAACLKKSEHS